MTETELTSKTQRAKGDTHYYARIRQCLQTIQHAFCQRAVTVLSHAAAPKHCWACSQRSGTPTRSSADRKLGRFQTEGADFGRWRGRSPHDP